MWLVVELTLDVASLVEDYPIRYCLHHGQHCDDQPINQCLPPHQLPEYTSSSQDLECRSKAEQFDPWLVCFEYTSLYLYSWLVSPYGLSYLVVVFLIDRQLVSVF